MIPEKEEIVAAHELIKPYIFKTDLRTSPELNEIAGCEIWLKCENQQKVKAFKARGALNAVLNLTEAEREKGITTHSSGNHAQAIAMAAKITHCKAFVVMPENAPKVKIEGVRNQGGEIVFCESNIYARETKVKEVIENTGATFIHPFDNHHVVCGQATVAKEILEEKPTIEILVAPVGGGGLLSGTGLSARYFSEHTIVYGAEPEGAADAVYSLKSGKIEHAKFIKTLADGLQTHLCERTLAIISSTAKDILLVPEDEIIPAIKTVEKYFAMQIEPSSAVAVAAVLRNPDIFKGKKVAIIITGGNLDPEKLGL